MTLVLPCASKTVGKRGELERTRVCKPYLESHLAEIACCETLHCWYFVMEI